MKKVEYDFPKQSSRKFISLQTVRKFMAVDWSVFWTNFLASFISALIILVIGTRIAWKITHSYQRKKDMLQIKNQLIDEIQELIFLLEEVGTLWVLWAKKTSDLKVWSETKLKARILNAKMRFVETKIKNWFSNFVRITFTIGTGIKRNVKNEFGDIVKEDMVIEYTLSQIIKSVFDYSQAISDSLKTFDVSNEMEDSIQQNRKISYKLVMWMLSAFVKEL